MEFDFEREYSGYSNAELLRVILLQHQYQPAAVAVAEALLATRTVTEADHELAAQSIRTKVATKKVAVAASEWKPGDDIFASVMPAVTFDSIRRRWLIILIGLGVVALYNLYHEARYFASPFARRYFFREWSSYFGLGIIALELTGLIYFYLRRRQGWVLTAVYVCYILLSGITALISTLVYHYYYNIGMMFVRLLLFSGIAVLVGSPEIRRFYDVDTALMRRTIIITAGIWMAYYAVIFSWFHLFR